MKKTATIQAARTGFWKRVVIALAWVACALNLLARSPPPTPMSTPIGGDSCLLFSNWKRAVCIDTTTGKVIWTKASQSVEQSPDGAVWIIDHETGYLSLFSNIREARSKRVCWFSAGLGPLLLDPKFVKDFDGTNLLMQAMSGPGGMAAEVDLHTQQVKWRAACDRVVAFSRDWAVLLTNAWGGQYQGGPGEPALVGLNRQEGTVAWVYPLPKDTWLAASTMWNGFVAVASYKHIACVRLRDGKEVARFDSRNDNTWVATSGGKLLCMLVPDPKIKPHGGWFELRPPEWQLEPTAAPSQLDGDYLVRVGQELIVRVTQHQFGGTVSAVEASSGKVRWTMTDSCKISKAIGDVIYLATARQILEVKVRDGTSRVLYQED